ncbi:MAG: methionyl-tRNA formyltransferase [Tannerella sp.]|jgi:methionyl-tRNA formyltransferase|nr:methionyl-tRNA formyltransferase [Tannerella sp.]
MTKKDLKIVFMGTPDFAVESLRALVEGGYNIVGVVAMPDKPMGRHGSILQPSAVKQYAILQNLPVLQPEKLKDGSFIEELGSLQADLQIVVAFRMLPEAVWNMPRFGTFNLHASLLPQYRGAAPINWAVINGEKETGATTFFLTHEIDTGRIIRQEKLPIAETDDAGVVHDALMTMGARLVMETVDLLIEKDGNIETLPQEALYESVGDLRPAPKIFKETCRINWRQSVTGAYNFIRGLSPYPAAWTEIINPCGEQTSLKIFRTEKLNESHNFAPGTIRTDGKNQMDVATEDGFIRILSLQLSGKKQMSIKDFLNGTKIGEEWRMY